MMSRGEVLRHNARQLLIELDQTLNTLAGAALALVWCLRLWPRAVVDALLF